MLYTIYYKRETYNQHHTYPQNYNRFVGRKVVKGKENISKIIADIEAKGHIITNIYDGTGKKVN